MDQIGKYRVEGELGRGGFGTVYRAWDPEMRRTVAIKVLTLAPSRTEAATTANLHHKNIVTVYDSGEQNGQPWFAMEFIDGKTLGKALQEMPPLELWEKVNILLQVAEGLQYAHDRGVIHRDIKPANVMLPDGGGVKVLDFGIARLMDTELTHHATTTGLVQGTFGYLAPEQLDGGKGDRASDIFSYGVICYETLTGVQPFLASTLVQTVHRVANFDPAPISRFVPDCPARLQEIVHKAIAKDPARRYRSLRDLILDLAPVEVSLRTARATQLARDAEALIEKGDREGAQASLDRALILDRLNEKGQALRRLSVAPPARPRPRRLRFLLASVAIGLAAIGLFYFKARPEAPRAAAPVPIAADNVAPVVQPARVPEPGAAETIQQEIKDRDWDDAALRLKQFEKLNPGDPRIRDWQNQIGKAVARNRKIAGLRSSAEKAIKSRNWGKADSEIRKLLAEAPGDAAVLKARQSVEDGVRDDQRVKSLRASIKSELKSKRWSEAERDIADLLSLVPGDSEANKWKAELAGKR